MRLPRVRHLLIAAILAIGQTDTYADNVEIQSVTGKVIDDFYFVDAQLVLEISADTREAVESGVPLTFVFDFKIERERRFLWDKDILSLRRSFELARHALANSYVVTDIVANKHIVSPSLDDALKVLGRVSDIAVGKARDLESNAELVGRMRAQLDIESLPAPLRPIAYISPSWRLKSAWRAWRIEQ